MQRREFLAGAVGFASTSYGVRGSRSSELAEADSEVLAYLQSIKPTRQRVDDFVAGTYGPRNLKPGEVFQFDPELGWVHREGIGHDGADGSKVIYSYETDGARKVVNFAGQPCRIHTYGNSFTHCSQANDNETWEEYLAAHLAEPVRNYGVGGYGVYQAYRRMLRVERQNPAEYLILNIWDDDHFRNLDAWRSIRLGPGSRCGFTLPHLKVDVAAGQCVQVENILKKPHELYHLCDDEFILRTFRADPILQMVMAVRSGEVNRETARPVAVSFGIPEELVADHEAGQRIGRIHTEAALFASRKVVEWAEAFAAANGLKLMVVLSFGKENVAGFLQGKERFDQAFVTWLKGRQFPVLDMCTVFAADFAHSRQNAMDYLEPFYNGHHTPKGNFFTAWALKKAVVDWLNPKPLTYR